MGRKQKISFSFGKNWTEYAKNYLNEAKIDGAKASLLNYLSEEQFKDKTFVDIGCGSGIFSLNALRLGCKKVVSFDVDRHSIEATNLTKEKFAQLVPKNSEWEIFEGSVLDENILNKFKGQFDIVYSWGVLHHTGNMWKAIGNAAGMVKPGGNFVIAIYNKAPSSGFWLRVKKLYNFIPNFLKVFISYPVFFYILIREPKMRQPKNIGVKDLVERERGMSIFYDVIDWLGGYPYEYATVYEINQFVEGLGFALIDNPTKIDVPAGRFCDKFSFRGTGCNEFVFKKK